MRQPRMVRAASQLNGGLAGRWSARLFSQFWHIPALIHSRIVLRVRPAPCGCIDESQDCSWTDWSVLHLKRAFEIEKKFQVEAFDDTDLKPLWDSL